jgi:MFS family permease
MTAGPGATAASEMPQRWHVLASFGLSLACNNLLFMSYATTPNISEDVLGLIRPARKHFDADGELDWLYTASLISVAVFMMPATYAVDRWNRNTNIAGAVANAGAAWLRFMASEMGSYAVALLSSILTGIAAAILMPTVAVVAGRWFRASAQAFAIAVAIQCGYVGWTLGALIPLFATDDASLRATLLVQGLVVTAALPAVLISYHDPPKGSRERLLVAGASHHLHPGAASPERAASPPPLVQQQPPQPVKRAQSSAAAIAIVQSIPKRQHYTLFHQLRGNSRFWVHCCCCATLEAISFAVPGVQGLIFGTCIPEVALPPAVTLWTNFTFLAVGVLCGALLSRVPDRHHPTTLKLLFVVATAAFVCLALVAAEPGSGNQPSGGLGVLVLLMAVGGGASLGFPGIGLAAVVASAPEVPEAYSCGITQLLSQLIGALATQLSGCAVSFKLCAGLCACATVGMLFLAKFETMEDANEARTPPGGRSDGGGGGVELESGGGPPPSRLESST